MNRIFGRNIREFMLVFGAFVFCQCNITYSGTADKIVWDIHHRLSFEDFRGTPDSDTDVVEGELEITGLAKISKALIIHVRHNENIATFSIYAAMDRERSWIKSQNDSASLKHEQGHFDITEIYARKLRKEIMHAKSLFDAKRLYWLISSEEEHEQNNYDKDNSGTTEGISQFWEQKIRRELDGLKAYENSQVSVKFKES